MATERHLIKSMSNALKRLNYEKWTGVIRMLQNDYSQIVDPNERRKHLRVITSSLINADRTGYRKN